MSFLRTCLLLLLLIAHVQAQCTVDGGTPNLDWINDGTTVTVTCGSNGGTASCGVSTISGCSTVICDTRDACRESMITMPQDGSVECKSIQTCDSSTITGEDPGTTSFDVECSGDFSCLGATINAGDDGTIDCAGPDSCVTTVDFAEFTTLGSGCLICGEVVDMRGTCDNPIFDPCEWNGNDCPSEPGQYGFCAPTASPTTAPTKAPTVAPTKDPSTMMPTDKRRGKGRRPGKGYNYDDDDLLPVDLGHDDCADPFHFWCRARRFLHRRHHD